MADDATNGKPGAAFDKLRQRARPQRARPLRPRPQRARPFARRPFASATCRARPPRDRFACIAFLCENSADCNLQSKICNLQSKDVMERLTGR